MLQPSNPYTPQEKTVITEIVITVIQIIFKNPWLFQKHFVPLRAAKLKHPDEALMDDIGEMWSLECSPKYYVDCWMNMMQKFFDVNDALKGILIKDIFEKY